MYWNIVVPVVLAASMSWVAAKLHRRMQGDFWRAVAWNCALFTVPIPFLVVLVGPEFMAPTADTSEPLGQMAIVKLLAGYSLISALMISIFIGWFLRTTRTGNK